MGWFLAGGIDLLIGGDFGLCREKEQGSGELWGGGRKRGDRARRNHLRHLGGQSCARGKKGGLEKRTGKKDFREGRMIGRGGKAGALSSPIGKTISYFLPPEGKEHVLPGQRGGKVDVKTGISIGGRRCGLMSGEFQVKEKEKRPLTPWRNLVKAEGSRKEVGGTPYKNGWEGWDTARL